MRASRRRIGAVVRKELREYRRNRSIIVTMAIVPILFSVQPLIAVLGLTGSTGLAQEHVLLYMLGIPTLVPLFVAAYAVAGERQQETLEPLLATPISREEFLLAKGLAALIPSVAVGYAVFLVFLGVVALFARPGVASAVVQGPDLLAQVLFSPPLAGWSIWIAVAISTRVSDVRVAQQVSLIASLPTVAVIVLIALDVVHPTFALGVGAMALLLVLNGLGWRLASRLFDREALITGSG